MPDVAPASQLSTLTIIVITYNIAELAIADNAKEKIRRSGKMEEAGEHIQSSKTKKYSNVYV